MMNKGFIGFLFLAMMLANLGAYGQILENYGPKILESYPVSSITSFDQIEVRVNLQSFPQADLRIGLPAGAIAFWEDKLWMMASADTVLVVSMAEVVDFLGGGLVPENKLSILLEDIDPTKVLLQKGYFDLHEATLPLIDTVGDKKDVLELQVRERSSFSDFFFTGLVGVLLLVAIYKLIYPFVLGLIVTPTSVVSAEDFSESTGLQKFFSLDILFYLLIINMAGFLLLMLFIDVTGKESVLFIVNGSLNQLFLYWLLGSLILAGVGILKFSFLRAFGFLFELDKIVIPHFFYLLRIISITIFVLVFAVAVIHLNNFIDLEVAVQYSIRLFFWVYLAGVFLLFWIMSSRVPFKNYHLFVYICTTELVPLLVISKIVNG